jgi:hypothetical protein
MVTEYMLHDRHRKEQHCDLMRTRRDTVRYNSASAMLRHFLYTEGEDIAENIKERGKLRVVMLLHC